MYRVLFILCIVYVGCGDPPPIDMSCPRPDIDFTWFRAHNKGKAKIYIKYTATPSGNIISSILGMVLDSIMPGQTDFFELRTDNDNFNHYYFYTDRNATVQLGKLILKNTQPATFGIPIVNLNISENFSTEQGILKVRSVAYNRSYCMRYIQIFNWQRWLFNYPSSPSTPESAAVPRIDCKIRMPLPSLAPTDKFQHLYFFTQPNPGGCDQPLTSEICRIIYRNTNPSKINMEELIVLD